MGACRPCRASSAAATSPLCPAPTTTASVASPQRLQRPASKRLDATRRASMAGLRYIQSCSSVLTLGSQLFASTSGHRAIHSSCMSSSAFEKCAACMPLEIRLF